MNNTSLRSSNFELLRIICMVMVVTLHTIGHGGGFKNTDINSNNFVILHFLQSLSIIAVNCYVLISGFFGINAGFKLKKLFYLYMQVLFYSIAISLLFWTTGIKQITLNGILSMIFPISMQTWWFMSGFLVLYILTPYINKFLKVLSLKEFNIFLLILLSVFIIWPSIPKLKPLDSQNGYGFYTILVYYIVGAYIKIFYENKKFNKNILILLYFLNSSFLAFFNIFISRFLGHNFGIYRYNFILVFISSILLFLFFKEIKIQNKFINKLSSLTLGVYLIHDHSYFRECIYTTLGYSNYYNTNSFIFYTFFIIITIYVVSSSIEYIRQILFKLLLNDKIYYKFEQKTKIIKNKLSL